MNKSIITFVFASLFISTAYSSNFTGNYCGSANVLSGADFIVSPQESYGCVEIIQDEAQFSIKDCWELRVINRSYEKINSCVSTDLILKGSELFFKAEDGKLNFVGKIVGNELTGSLKGVELKIKKNQNKSLNFYRSFADEYIREAFSLNMR